MATYSTTEVVVLTANMYNFLYGISQQIQASPSVLNIPGYQESLSSCYNNLNMAKTAGIYEDQGSAQAAINRFNTIANNSTIFLQ